ncbi:MAG: lysophospholipid acyltransferase family protein [Aquificaceae bacterium]|nr:lysophospholipid acyltransferase family protein [Aquificaceae bacterium]
MGSRKYRARLFIALRKHLLSPLLVWFLRLWAKSMKLEKRMDFETLKGHIIAILHGNALCAGLISVDRGFFVLVSRFRDGEFASEILSGLGHTCIRGSSEEGKPEKGGSAALLKLIRLCKEGHSVVITVDGPKGPRGVVKPGVVLLAQRASVPILPTYISCERAIRLKSWDRHLVPLPFSKLRVVFAKPIFVSADDLVEAKLSELEAAFREIAGEEYGL